MRISVLFVDLLVFFPSVLLAVSAVFPDTELRKNSGAILSLATMALYPGLILIDNGHFQYNNASLGQI